MPFVPHLSYLPDLALRAFYLFPKMKIKLKDEDLTAGGAKHIHEKRNSRRHSITGRSAGRGIYAPNGTTLKFMVLNKVPEWCTVIY